MAILNNSDAYNRIPDSGRERQTVCHSMREYARDDDQDGFYEVPFHSIAILLQYYGKDLDG